MAVLSEEQRKKKVKMLVVAPAVVIPFLALVFWALGGGNTNGRDAGPAGNANAGINTELPGAKNKDDRQLDKMGFYEIAEQDSLKRKEAIENDPYYSKNELLDTSRGKLIIERDENEMKVYSKLEELNKELAKNVNQQDSKTDHPRLSNSTYHPHFSEDADRLEALLKTSIDKDTAVDNETLALNNMLEKILDIKHPERVTERLRQVSREEESIVLPVHTNNEESIHAKERAIWAQNDGTSHSVIPAEIAESRSLHEKATVKIRVLSELFIMGKLIPENTFVHGTVSFDDSRMQIVVSGVYYDNNIFPVQLSVYDLSGIKGLELQANIRHELVRQSGERGIQNMNLNSPDPTIGAQAVTAGIEVAKNIMSKKIRQINVPIKAGQEILLVDDRAVR